MSGENHVLNFQIAFPTVLVPHMLPGGHNPGPFAQGRPHDLPVLPSHCRPSPDDTSDNDDSVSSLLQDSSESDSDSLLFSDKDGEEHVRDVHDDHGETAHDSAATDHRSKQSAVPWTEFATGLAHVTKGCGHSGLLSLCGRRHTPTPAGLAHVCCRPQTDDPCLSRWDRQSE